MNKFKSVAIGLALTLSCCVANAAPIDDVYEDFDLQKIIVSGSGLAAGTTVVIQIADAEGMDLTDRADIESSDVECMAVAVAGDDGKYEKAIKFPGLSGTKLVRVKTSDTEPTGEKTLSYYGNGDISKVVLDWNEAVDNNSTDDMETILETPVSMHIILGSEDAVAVYNKFDYADKTDLAVKMLAIGKGEKISDFSDKFKSEFAVFAVNASNKETLTKDVLVCFEDYFGFDSEAVFSELFSAMDSDAKNDVYSSVYTQVEKQDKALSADEIVQIFCEQILVNAIKNEENNLNVQPLMAKYNDGYFNLDFTKYGKLENKYHVNSAILDNTNQYSDCKELADYFKKLVDEQYEEETGDSGSPGGGGGGGGSSGGFSGGGASSAVTYAPTVITEPLQYVPDNIFEDIEGYDWAKNDILHLYKKGVISGVGEKKFEPERNITREEFVKLLVEILGITETAECDFNDVDAEKWYYKYISIAAKNGIVNGTSETTFGVGENITRQDMAVMCFNAMRYLDEYIFESDLADNIAYSDAGDVASYALYPVTVLTGREIINGVGDNCFAPNETATRAQAAVIIGRMADNIGLLK